MIGDLLCELSSQFYYTHDDFPVIWHRENAFSEKHLNGRVKGIEWWHEDEIRAFFPNLNLLGKKSHIPKDLRSVRIASNHFTAVPQDGCCLSKNVGWC